MHRAKISGIGMYVPEQVVNNDDLAELMDTSDAWIQQRTGIRQRRYAADGVGTSDLALPAAENAIRDAGIDKDEVDLILFATLSPDHHFPGTCCYFQAKLGLHGVPALDLRTQCTGFLYGLAIASSFVRCGMYRNVLLVGAEVHSHALDFSTAGRDVTVLFGDGAGAAIVSRAEPGESSELHSFHLHSDGRHADALCLKVWDIAKKPYIMHDGQVGLSPPDKRWPYMNGREVFRHAVTGMAGAIQEACQANGLTPADIELLVPHQANMRINQLVARNIGLPAEKVVHTIGIYGNTTAASIPMAMCKAQEDGRLQRGMQVMLAGFGSGFTWGAAYLTY